MVNYAETAAQFDRMMAAGTAEVLDAGLGWMTDLLPPVVTLLVMFCGTLMALGQLHTGTALKYAGRLVLLLALVSAGTYADAVVTPILDTIPDEIASRLNGLGASLTAAEQFDIVANTLEEMTEVALANATGLLRIADRAAIHGHNAWGSGALAVMFWVWVAMRMLLHLVVMLGAFLLVLIPFDTTNGIVREWGAKVVGVLAWQLVAAILLKVSLTGSMLMLERVAQAGTPSLAAQIAQLRDIARWCLGMLVLFLVAPAACGFGAGIASASTMAAGLAGKAASFGLGVGGRVAGVAVAGLGRGTVWAVGAARARRAC